MRKADIPFFDSMVLAMGKIQAHLAQGQEKDIGLRFILQSQAEILKGMAYIINQFGDDGPTMGDRIEELSKQAGNRYSKIVRVQ